MRGSRRRGLFEQRAEEIGEVQSITAAEIGRIIVKGATNPHVLLGVLLEAVFFGALLYLLSPKRREL